MLCLLELESLSNKPLSQSVTLHFSLLKSLPDTEDAQRPTGRFSDEVKIRRHRAGVPCSVPVRLSVNVPVIGLLARSKTDVTVNIDVSSLQAPSHVLSSNYLYWKEIVLICYSTITSALRRTPRSVRELEMASIN